MRMARVQPYLQLLPVFIVFAVVFAYPWVTTVSLSLTKWNPAVGPYTPKFTGLGNYVKIFADKLFYHSLQNTIIMVLLLIFVQIPLGLGIALLLNRELKAERVIVTSILVPALVAPAVAGLIWKLFVYPEVGLFNWFLGILGLPSHVWTTEYPLVILLVFIVGMWLELPFVTVVLLAGLKAIPTTQFDSAQIDGASRVQVLRYIILPYIAPLIAIVLIFEMFFILRTFDIVYTLTGPLGGPGNVASVLGTYMYFVAFKTFDLGLGSAISVVLFLVSLGVTGGLLFSVRKELTV